MVDSHPLPEPLQEQQRLKQKPRATTKGPVGDYGLSYPTTFPEGTNGQAFKSLKAQIFQKNKGRLSPSEEGWRAPL